jgi:hypothetical protein
MAVPITKFEQLESIAANGVSHNGTSLLKGVQTTGISLNKRKRSNDFIISGNFLEDYVTMTSNKQEDNNGSGSDICGRTGELTNCQFCEKFISCVQFALLHKVTEALRLIKEVDRHNQSLDVFSGLVSSERSVGSELGTFYKWHQGGISEGHALRALLVPGITELFQNRSLTFRFVPGITVNVLTKKVGPDLINLSVKLVHGGEEDGNHFVEAGKVVRVASAPAASHTFFGGGGGLCNVWKRFLKS